MINLEYLTNQEGQPTAVVIPIDIWRQLLPTEDASLEELAKGIENYCLNKAVNTLLVERSIALAYLEE